jgi:AcrR family transcriptional regulator
VNAKPVERDRPERDRPERDRPERDRPERDRHGEILDAAFTRFSQYGFRNTSIDDIARAAGISRPLVYQYFANKEAVLRELALHLHEQVLVEASAALADTERSLADQVADALIAKMRIPVEVIGPSDHHAELLDTSSRLAGDLAAEAMERYDVLLHKHLAAARRDGLLAPRCAELPVGQLVRLLREAAGGVAGAALERPERWRDRLRTLVHLVLDQGAPTP